MFKRAKAKLVVVGAALAVGATNAMAALTEAELTTLKADGLNNTDSLAIGLIVLAALGGIWGLKKAMTFVR